MPNTERGEFTIEIGELEITICPTYGKQARAAAVVGGKTVQALLFALGGEGVGIAEQANYIEQLSKPRIKHDVIGKELARIGALNASVIFSEVITSLAEGSKDGEESSVEDDDEGK